MSVPESGYAVILAHCTYVAHGIRDMSVYEVPSVIPPGAYMAVATIVEHGRALASMLFRCDMPPTDPRLPLLVGRLVEANPRLHDLMDEDPGRGVVVDPIDDDEFRSLIPDPAGCRELFLLAFLRNTAAGAA